MVEGCVRLGEAVTSCIDGVVADVADDGGIDGAAGGGLEAAGDGADCDGVDDIMGVEGTAAAGCDATAAAAAAAYLTGGNCTGGRGAEGVVVERPALTMLDIGCCAKFGFGGGFDDAEGS